MKKGKLIVFEGVSGTGKETQAKLLQKFLTKKGIPSHIVFHPSPELKSLLRRQASPLAEIQLLAKDRAHRVTQDIAPALARGEWVISLRNYVSAMVYQGDTGNVQRIDIQPDYLFYFDISPEIAMERIVSRGETRGKYEKIILLEQKRKKYMSVLRHIPHVTIDADQSIEHIHTFITSRLSTY
jgi:dTMP kinase